MPPSKLPTLAGAATNHTRRITCWIISVQKMRQLKERKRPLVLPLFSGVVLEIDHVRNNNTPQRRKQGDVYVRREKIDKMIGKT